MNKQWKKSRITVVTSGNDKVARNRNMANAIEDISVEQMDQLGKIVAELTGNKFESGKLVREDSFID